MFWCTYYWITNWRCIYNFEILTLYFKFKTYYKQYSHLLLFHFPSRAGACVTIYLCKCMYVPWVCTWTRNKFRSLNFCFSIQTGRCIVSLLARERHSSDVRLIEFSRVRDVTPLNHPTLRPLPLPEKKFGTVAQR